MRISNERFRLAFLSLAFLLVMLIFVIRLSNLQIVKGEYYLDLQNKGTQRLQTIKAARGEVVDRNGSPFVSNAVSYNVVFDKALEQKGGTNETILKLIVILTTTGEEWEDSLPLNIDGTAFDGSEQEIKRLKSKNFLDLNSYTSAKDVFHWVKERYNLQEYSATEARAIAGVRYEMEKMGYSYSTQYIFAEDISLETSVLIRQLARDLTGVNVVEAAKITYIDGSLAPHIIGRTGVIVAEELEKYLALERGYTQNDIVGLEGIEKAYEHELRGKDGVRKITLDTNQKVTDVMIDRDAVPGNTVVMTLDKNLQRAGIEGLEKQIKYLNETAPAGKGKEANAGAIVAVDVKTGEILLSASYPTYDLSTYSEDFSKNSTHPVAPFLNRAFNGLYAPGSCFKPVTALAGLDQGLNEYDTHIFCNRVYTYFPSYQPTCLQLHGDFTVVDALRHSCNTFFYDTGRRLGIANINDYARQLGLGVPSGIELYESKGTQCDPDSVNPGDALQAAIGQLDNGYTPLQLANYTSILARNGDVIPLSLVKSVSSYYDYTETVLESPVAKSAASYEDYNQTAEQGPVRETIPTAIPVEHFETIREGMIQATHDPLGTAYYYLGDYPITVASKTGTPQTAEFPNSTFICYAPAEDPQIAIAVVIEKGWHGYTGAPVARAVLDAYFFPETLEPIEGEDDAIDPENPVPTAQPVTNP